MELFSKLISFLYQNRNKFIYGGLVIGGSYAAYQFANYKLKEIQERGIQDMLEDVRRQRYFQTVMETCNQTIVNLDKTLHKSLNELTNINNLVETLKKLPSNKVAVWQELKIASFTHLVLLIYIEALLVTILRIQLGIIGGLMYKEKISDKTWLKPLSQEKYLSLFVDFAKDGLKDVYVLIKDKVGVVLSEIKLSDNLTVQKLKEVLWSMQTSFSYDEKVLITHLIYTLHIKNLIEENSDPMLKEIYSDTIDLLCNIEVATEIYSSVSCGFIHFTDRITAFYPGDDKQNGVLFSKSASCDYFNKSIPLARLIPIVCNVACINDQCEMPSPWLEYLISSEKLKILCANVYEAYC